MILLCQRRTVYGARRVYAWDARRPIRPAHSPGMTSPAQAIARDLFEQTLPRRWAHTQGVKQAAIDRTRPADTAPDAYRPEPDILNWLSSL